MISKKIGVVVVSVDKESECGNIKIGDYITHVGGRHIQSSVEFEEVITRVNEGERVTMVVGWGPGGCTAIGDGNVGLDVVDAPSKSLKFGLDIYGGKKVWLSVDAKGTELENIKSVIEKRAKVVGTSHLKVGIDNDRLSVDTLDVNNVPLLISKGVLEGRIEESVKLLDGVGQIKIGPDYYDIKISNASASPINATIIVEGSEYGVGDSFVIGGVSFKLLNITNDSIAVGGLIFNNKDAKPGADASSYIRYESDMRRYQFFVPVELSESAAAAFSKIIDGMPSMYVGGVSILEGTLVFYIDGEEINRLTIPTAMADQSIKSLSITGVGLDMNEATVKKKVVEMALVGSIDYDISIDETTEYKTGGEWMLYTLVGIVCGLSIILFILPFVIYKQHKGLKISFWSSFLLLSVIFTVFGIASISQSAFSPGWVLDSISITGILVLSVWVSIQMILTSEKILKRGDAKLRKYFDVVLLFSSFILLFTRFTGFGIAVIGGAALNKLIVSPVYKKILSSL